METEAAELPLIHRLWAWFETNKKQAGIGLAFVAIAGLILWFVSWHRDQKEIKASEAVSSVSLAPTMGGTRTDTGAALLNVASDYADTSAGARALLMAGGSFFTDGKYDDALKAFQRFTREHRESPWMGTALLGMASCNEMLGKISEAQAIYQDIKDHHASDAVAPQAKFALARIYEKQNKPDIARPLYEDLVRTEPYSSIGSEAGIRLEELNTKVASPVVEAPPSVAPAPVPQPAVPLASTNPAPFKLEER
jgi:tetratricopeptide (TPR) repeat protein